MEPVKNKIGERNRGDDPAPISVKNKTKRSVDFNSAIKNNRVQSPVSCNSSNNKYVSEIEYIDLNDHRRFYNE